MTVTNYTEAASAPGTWAKTTIRGKGDPGYLLTAGEMVSAHLAFPILTAFSMIRYDL